MTTRRKKIEPFVREPGGSITLNLHAGEENADWIRTARLKRQAEGGDRKARREFRRLQRTDMVILSRSDQDNTITYELDPDENHIFEND